MGRRVQIARDATFGTAALLIAATLAAPSLACQVPASAIKAKVDEEHDGLPGQQVGPTRQDIEALIRAIGRDSVSADLIDRIDALFRPRWANARKFEDVRKRAIDPAFVAKVDDASRAAASKAASTSNIVECAALAQAGDEYGAIRPTLKASAAREAAPRKTIKGRLVDDETGKPIADAVVSMAGGMARSDARGRYALRIAEPSEPGQAFVITIEAPGYALTQTAIDWKEMSDPQVQDYSIPRSVVFGGRVVDAQNKPIRDAELILYLRGDPIGRDGTMIKLGLGGAVQFRAKTDADGMYAFRNIPPDLGPRQAAYNLSVSHAKYQPRRKVYNQNELLGPGWEITMEEGFTIRGIVVDGDGKPVSGASLTAMAQPVTGTYPAVATDADGKFRFDNLPLGAVQVLLRPQGYIYKRVEAQSGRGETEEITIAVEKGDYFEGKVVDEDGKPVAGATVGYLQAVDDKGQAVANNGAGSPSTRSGDDGTFRLGPVAKGRYRVMAIRNGTEGQKNGVNFAETGTKDMVIQFGANPQ